MMHTYDEAMDPLDILIAQEERAEAEELLNQQGTTTRTEAATNLNPVHHLLSSIYPVIHDGNTSASIPSLATREIWGVCQRCHDHFSIEVYAKNRRLVVVETPRVKYSANRDALHHHPAQCNGRITLYGSHEALSDLLAGVHG